MLKVILRLDKSDLKEFGKFVKQNNVEVSFVKEETLKERVTTLSLEVGKKYLNSFGSQVKIVGRNHFLFVDDDGCKYFHSGISKSYDPDFDLIKEVK